MIFYAVDQRSRAIVTELDVELYEIITNRECTLEDRGSGGNMTMLVEAGNVLGESDVLVAAFFVLSKPLEHILEQRDRKMEAHMQATSELSTIPTLVGRVQHIDSMAAVLASSEVGVCGPRGWVDVFLNQVVSNRLTKGLFEIAETAVIAASLQEAMGARWNNLSNCVDLQDHNITVKVVDCGESDCIDPLRPTEGQSCAYGGISLVQNNKIQRWTRLSGGIPFMLKLVHDDLAKIADRELRGLVENELERVREMNLRNDSPLLPLRCRSCTKALRHLTRCHVVHW